MSEERDEGLALRRDDDERLEQRAAAGEVGGDPELATWAPSLLPARTGRAAVPPAGDREVRRPAVTRGRPGWARHAWVPVGPRNVAGRMRAVVCGEDPTGADPQLWFAASAGGGVWRSTDAGRRWEALPGWHEQTSLTVGALAVAPSDRRWLYAATGEARPASAISMRGVGVVVSEDGGRTWTNHAPPGGSNPAHVGGFEAVAVDPRAGRHVHAWAVGLDGAFRTLDGGRTWARVSREHWTDAVFSGARLLLVRGRAQGAEGAVVRLDAPDAPDPAVVSAALAAPAARSVVVAARPLRAAWPSGGKLALSPASPARAYVRMVDEEGRHVGVFRTTNADAAAGRDITWTRLPDHADWPTESQGTYCLCLAVGTDGGHDVVVTGMVQLHAAAHADGPAAAVRWRRVMHWGLHDDGLRGHHADHHALVVAGAPPSVWVADDGGIARAPLAQLARSPDVGPERPAARGTPAWERRDTGISGAQAYDLEQSPLVPTALAVGLQDHGTYLRSGGLTWRPVFGADGGFAAFDPDDPYRLHIAFYGGMLALQHPALLDRAFPDDARGAAPVVGRRLSVGLEDDAPFVPPTSRDRRRTGRAFHARYGSLYALTGAGGERFERQAVGRSFALLVRPAGAEVQVPALPRPLRAGPVVPGEPRTVVEVADTPGAVRLGLLPGRGALLERVDLLSRERVVLRSRLAAPYRLTAGDEVRITVDGTTHSVRFTAADAADLSATTLAEALAVLGRFGTDRLTAVAEFWDPPTCVALVTRGTGPAERITLGGDALAPLADGLSRLGVNAGAYAGDTGRPASVLLGHVGGDDAAREVNRDLSAGPVTLDVAIGAGPVRHVRLDAPDVPDRSRLTAGRLAAALRTALAGDPVDVVTGPLSAAVQLLAEPGARVVLTGTLADHLALPPAGAPLVRLGPRSRESVHLGRQVRAAGGALDLRPVPPAVAPLELVVSDGTTRAPALVVRPTDVADLRAVTPEELHALLRRHLAGSGVRVRADLVVAPATGFAREPVWSPAAEGVAWVGARDGGVFRTDDGGRTWRETTDPRMRLDDREVEALLPHPTDAATAWVGLAGEPGPPGAACLWRTGDAGRTWVPLGLPPAGGGAGGLTTGGRPLGVNALVGDPGDAAVLLAATDAGVWRSADSGQTWVPVSEGLPNAPVVDLAVDPDTRVLRAALWSRGVWERRLDDGPPDDVRLVVRATEADDGHRPARRAPSYGTAAAGVVPPGSPDVRVVRRRPAALAADASVDGVAFDLVLPDDDVVAGTSAEVLVQVADLGPTPVPAGSPPADAERVRVVLLMATADDGLPPLPADLGQRVRGGAVPVGDLGGGWTVLGDGQVPRTVGPGDTGVVGFAVTWPALAGVRSVGLLALATAVDDPLPERLPVDVEALVARERRAAVRTLPVLRPEADRTLHLRSTDGRPFVVDAPPAAEAGSAATALGLLAADLGAAAPARTGATAAGDAVALPAADPGPGLVVRSAAPVPTSLSLLPEAGEVASPAAVTAGEAAALLAARALRAGLPLRVFRLPVAVRLTGRGGALLRASGPAAPRLGLPVGGPGAAERTTTAAQSYDLAGAGALTLTLVLGATTVAVAVDLSPARTGGRTRLGVDDVVRAVVEDLRTAGVEALLAVRSVDAPALYFDGPALTATLSGTGRTALGLPTGERDWFVGGPGPVDLSAGPVLEVALSHRTLVRFDADPADVPDLAAARHADLRRTITRACGLTGTPVVAGPPAVDLRVAASTSDPGPRHPVLASAALAELAVTPAATPAGDRAALFAVRAALRDDRLRIGAPNFLYARVRNLGTADAPTARVRVLRLEQTGGGVTATAVATAAVAVPASAVVVPELGWDAAGAAPGPVLLLVVVDEAPAREVAVPSPFADLAEVRRFARRPGVAVRQVEAQR